MEQLVGGLMSLLILGAIIYIFARATAAFIRATVRAILDPIHAKLDRLLVLQERVLGADAAQLAPKSTDEGPR